MKKLARISSFDSKRSPVPERKEVSKQLDNLLGRTYQKLGNFLFHKKVFFTKLEKIVSVGSPVPEFIENICSVLEGAERHRKYSFIYRSMGNSANIAILRRQIEADKMEVLDDVKPTDDLTGLFKDFLLHLPSPTIPWDIAERIYALSKKQNYQLVEVKDLLNTVPYYHLKLLERIVIHFKRLLAFQKDNHLTEYSQSMLVSPCLTWPKVQKAENAVKDTDIQIKAAALSFKCIQDVNWVFEQKPPVNNRKSQDLNLTVNLLSCDPSFPSSPSKNIPKNKKNYDSTPLFPPSPEGVRGLIRSIGLSPTEVQDQHAGSLPDKVGRDRAKLTRLSNPECKLKC